MQGRLSKLIMAAGAAATVASVAMIPRPASADTTSTILTAAAALGAVVLFSDYEHQRAEANTIVGYTRNGGTVYGDGRIVMPDGETFYPRGNGGYAGPDGVVFFGVNNAYYNGYFNSHAYAGPYAYNRGYVPAPAYYDRGSGYYGNRNVPVYENRNAPVYENRNAPVYQNRTAPVYQNRNAPYENGAVNRGSTSPNAYNGRTDAHWNANGNRTSDTRTNDSERNRPDDRNHQR